MPTRSFRVLNSRIQESFVSIRGFHHVQKMHELDRGIKSLGSKIHCIVSLPFDGERVRLGKIGL